MRRSNDGINLSATDLASFFECEHKTALDLDVAYGERQRPGQNELERELLETRGREHEARVLQHYRSKGLSVHEVPLVPRADTEARARAARETLDAMAEGFDVVYQGVLLNDQWTGRPDFLVKVAAPGGKSQFGTHAYEPVDAKLARHEKARAVLQLCAYADQLEVVQGVLPEHFQIVSGGQGIVEVRLRTVEYMAYYRQSKRRLGEFLSAADRQETYPEPVDYCDVCEWWRECNERRRQDDHLSLVAGITRRQRSRLVQVEVTTLKKLAVLPSDEVVVGIDAAPLERIREQARLQYKRYATGEPQYDLLTDGDTGTGFEGLPVPRPGDLFLDLEGDAFVHDGGLEYLFGLVELGEPVNEFVGREAPGAPRYHAFWASNRAEEKKAFQDVVKRINQGLDEFSDLHVFHFGHRENDAFKKLSCRHATCEEDVDRFLRAGVLVDLHTIVKQSLRASVESYSLKELEKLHGFARTIEPRQSARAMQMLGWWLETGDALSDLREVRQTVEKYNEEDCLSTWRLREWLEERRPELEHKLGRRLGRLAPPVEEKPQKDDEKNADAEQVRQLLTQNLPRDPAEDGVEDEAKRLLANLLSWHWREAKSGYWEYHEARKTPVSERLESRLVLAGLDHVGPVGQPVKESLVHRYEFPHQEHAVRRVPSPHDPDTGKAIAKVVKIGPSFIDIKRAKSSKEPHPLALIPGKPLSARSMEARLIAFASSVATEGLSANATFGAARDLLLRRVPRCGQPEEASLVQDGEDTVEAVKRLCLQLDGSTLAIQGPPGSGKTHRAAEAIVALVRQGRKIGVTATSHRVITDLLRKVCERAGDGAPCRVLQMAEPEDVDAKPSELPFELSKKYDKIETRLAQGDLNVVGGTVFAWSRQGFDAAIDTLFVDEAGQISLANVLAISGATRNLVLVGDPAQLEQPTKGVHPLGAEVSALEHLLHDEQTIRPHMGVFLPETRRLHPDICAFTSRVFYEGRLNPLSGLDSQRIEGPEPFNGAGLRLVRVEHQGNTNRSDEEIAEIEMLVRRLLNGGAQVIGRGDSRNVTERDVLVVAPYNSQVAALREVLPAGVDVGTVDRFQGKEAPIVIYSMTTSSGDEAPRGMDFLYSLNRLNVATSRAQTLVVLVMSPALTRVRCRTPGQMKLINALCAYVEEAKGAGGR